MEKEKIHDALEKAINSDPIKQKAFDDMQGIHSDADREALINKMSDDMSKQVGGKAVFAKVGAVLLGHHGDTEETYAKMDKKFDEALKDDIKDPTLRAAIAQEAANNYVTGIHGEKYNPNHHEAMEALQAKGIELEVKKGIDEAFASTIPDALHSKLPGPLADKAMDQLREGVNKDELAATVTDALSKTYPSDEFKNASPEARHAMIAQAVKTEFEKHDVINLQQTEIGQAGGKLLDIADGLGKAVGIDAGLSKHAEMLNGIARDAASTAIAGEVADKVVPGNGSTDKNLMAGVNVAAHEVVGEITHGLSGIFGGGKSPIAIG